MNIGGARVLFDMPHIFIVETTSPMNILVLYSSVTRPHQRICGSKAGGVRLAYIHQLTDKYRPVQKPPNPLSCFWIDTAPHFACLDRHHTHTTAATHLSPSRQAAGTTASSSPGLRHHLYARLSPPPPRLATDAVSPGPRLRTRMTPVTASSLGPRCCLG
jgi:hypothetical protein